MYLMSKIFYRIVGIVRVLIDVIPGPWIFII